MINKSKAEENIEKRRFWKEHIYNWQKGNLSQVEYCRKNDLIPHRFTYWKQRIVKQKETPVSLVQVNMQEKYNGNPTPYASPLRLVFKNQFHIEIDRNFDPVTLKQLLLTLRQV